MNCIAILGTKIYPESKENQEWRVVLAHAIKNVYKNDKHMYRYFKNSKVFDSFEDAIIFANHLEVNYGPTDMGIIIVRHPLDKTWDEIEHQKSFNTQR